MALAAQIHAIAGQAVQAVFFGVVALIALSHGCIAFFAWLSKKF